MKKRIIIPIFLFFVLPYLNTAQESPLQQEEYSIYCSEFSIEVDGFEVADSAQIYVCCGGLFQDSAIPCKLLNKANYESFSGQSDVIYNLDKNGFLISELLIPIKNKVAKLKKLSVIDSSIYLLGNNGAITIKKGNYNITADGMVYLEIEYLK
ncbi:MAG: hypothetical protein KBC56_06930 [Flavobacterium sp.]|nr:hypothetical protein [Flavobacterium sp.]